jgi:hypothetical protein
VQLGTERSTFCGHAERYLLRLQHSKPGHHLRVQRVDHGGLVCCKFRRMPEHAAQHDGLCDGDVWGSCLMEQQEAVNNGCIHDGSGVPGLRISNARRTVGIEGTG